MKYINSSCAAISLISPILSIDTNFCIEAFIDIVRRVILTAVSSRQYVPASDCAPTWQTRIERVIGVAESSS